MPERHQASVLTFPPAVHMNAEGRHAQIQFTTEKQKLTKKQEEKLGWESHRAQQFTVQTE